MEIIFTLIGISVFLAMFFLGAFIWSIKKGQFDDPFTPGIRILFDESKKSSKTKNK